MLASTNTIRLPALMSNVHGVLMLSVFLDVRNVNISIVFKTMQF
jgi:hypothetical protein